MIRASVFMLVLGSAMPAAAHTVTFHTTGGYQSVRVVMVGDENGGFVNLQAGTILASRNPDEQNLTLSTGIEADLEPGQRREMVIPTFCLHYDRRAPAPSQTMEIAGRVDRDVMSVIFDARGQAPRAHQAAIWALRQGTPPRGDAAALIERLGLRVKPRA